MNFVKALLKVIVAGAVALVILSVLFIPVGTIPVHIPNEQKNTDYKWPADSVWMKFGENFTWGKYDSFGFNNDKFIESPDLLLIGSSHVEATYVLPGEGTADQLAQKLAGNMQIYNLGISGHGFDKCCQYLPRNMELYPDCKAIIIETSSTLITADDVNKIKNGTVDFTPSHNEGVIAMLQNIPFLRTIYQNYDNGLKDILFPKRSAVSNKESNFEIDFAAYDELMSWISELSHNNGIKVIIFYHPFEQLTKDGEVCFPDTESCGAFCDACDKYGITFVDMSDAFLEMYKNEQHVPHGFSTGSLGHGHLNKYGHSVIANELYDVIMKLEKEGSLCR